MTLNKLWITFLISSVLSIVICSANVVHWLKDAFGHEHCGSQWIEPNFHGLIKDFKETLYGQHLASHVVTRLLQGHLDSGVQPEKALALSFHGPTGVGKNFVSSIVANSLYKNGLDSKFVKHFRATIDFVDKGKTQQYQLAIQRDVSATVKSCHRSLFIFDEVEKMPAEVLDSLKPFLEHYAVIDGVDYRGSIFLFLSNTGGSDITRITLEHWKKGDRRVELQLKDIEPTLLRAVFNEEGGLAKSSLIEKHLISAYVPFLPLERSHVKLCIKDDLKRKRKPVRDEELTNKIADELEYFPQDSMVFSRSGCKRVTEKVDLWTRSAHSEL